MRRCEGRGSGSRRRFRKLFLRDEAEIPDFLTVFLRQENAACSEIDSAPSRFSVTLVIAGRPGLKLVVAHPDIAMAARPLASHR